MSELEKEHAAISEHAAYAATIRDVGGECRCGERYGIFKLELRDGRVFRHIGLHGWGGLFRIEPGERVDRERLLRRAQLRLEQDRAQNRDTPFYLTYFYCGADMLYVKLDDVAALELE